MFCEPTLAMASCRRRVKRPVRVEGRHVHAAVRSQWWLSAHLIAIGSPAAFLRVPINHPAWSSGTLVFVEGSAESVSSADFKVHGLLCQADRFG